MPDNIKIVTVSGGFDPIHVGHIRMFKEARSLGDKLVVILNNDNWLRAKKGFTFMPEQERAEIIRHFPFVDDVVITKHLPDDSDRSVCRELREIKPTVFANGGDRFADDVPEAKLCAELGIKMHFMVGGGKAQSSSWLTGNIPGKITKKPWGSMEMFRYSDKWWIKTITVEPKQRLSLQKHSKRSEIWICLEGDVTAEISGKQHPMYVGDIVNFDKGTMHRLSSKNGGTIVEVAHGEEVSEKDITRLSDDYGRV